MQGCPFIGAVHLLPLAAFAAPIVELSGLPLDFADFVCFHLRENTLLTRRNFPADEHCGEHEQEDGGGEIGTANGIAG
jgi:hypothetical protein